MDSFEFNKIAGAVLATALGVMALSIISETIYAPAPAKTPGYIIAVAATPPPSAGASAAPAVEPIAVRLASASLDNGADIAKKCLACHTLMKDQPAKVGPNLFGVLGGPSAHMEGFKYSDAMLAEHSMGLTWTYANLDQFLTAPKTFIPGTAMGFAGLPSPKDRADVIAYIRTLSDNPIPLPAVADAGSKPAAAPAAPAPAK
jgi:cytochrome c